MISSTRSSDRVAQSKHQIIHDAITQDTPKIDVAIKAYASYLMAGSVSNNIINDPYSSERHNASSSIIWSVNDVLAISRLMSKHMNQHTCSCATTARTTKRGKRKSDEDDLDELISEVTVQVWNELVASSNDQHSSHPTTGHHQKPTKVLGRMALTVIWEDLDVKNSLYRQNDDDWNEKVNQYVDKFQTLLYSFGTQHNSSSTTSSVDASVSDDSHLIWDLDGGKAELTRRATSRRDRAKLMIEQQQQQQPIYSPTIEEMPDNEEDNNA